MGAWTGGRDVAARQVPCRPGGHRVHIAQTTKRVDQPGEARPSKPAQPTVLESADDGLIHPAQKFELTLRYPEPLAAAADQLSDQPESAVRRRISFRHVERLPSHPLTMTADTHLALYDASGAASGSPRKLPGWSQALMQLECIKRCQTRMRRSALLRRDLGASPRAVAPGHEPVAWTGTWDGGPEWRNRLREWRDRPRVCEPTRGRCLKLGTSDEAPAAMHSSCISVGVHPPGRGLRGLRSGRSGRGLRGPGLGLAA